MSGAPMMLWPVSPEELAKLLADAAEAGARKALASLHAPSPAGSDAVELVGYKDAGRAVSVGPRTIEKWVGKGKIRQYGPPGARRVRLAEVLAFMAGTGAPASGEDAQVIELRTKLRGKP